MAAQGHAQRPRPGSTGVPSLGRTRGGTGRAVPATAAGRAGCRAEARGRADYKIFCLGFKLEKHPSPLFQAEFSSGLCRVGTSLCPRSGPTAQRGGRQRCGAEPSEDPRLCVGAPPCLSTGTGILPWCSGGDWHPLPHPRDPDTNPDCPPAPQSRPDLGDRTWPGAARCRLLGNGECAAAPSAAGAALPHSPGIYEPSHVAMEHGENIKSTYSSHFSRGQL